MIQSNALIHARWVECRRLVVGRRDGNVPCMIEAHVKRTSERWGAGLPAALTPGQSDAG